MAKFVSLPGLLGEVFINPDRVTHVFGLANTGRCTVSFGELEEGVVVDLYPEEAVEHLESGRPWIDEEKEVMWFGRKVDGVPRDDGEETDRAILPA